MTNNEAHGPDLDIRVHRTCCDTWYASVAESMNHKCNVELFERILDSEASVMSARASEAFVGCGASLWKMNALHRSYEAAREAHGALIDELFAHGDDEVRAFGRYRAEVLAEREV